MKSADAGYSGTPLVKKLGLKDHHRGLFIDLPDGPLAGLTQAVASADKVADAGSPLSGPYSVVLYFTKDRSALEGTIVRLMGLLERDGMIWIAWPKRASKVATDVTEDVIRSVALPVGLVDTKVCAVDSTWSALKLVIRKELR